MQTGWGGKFLRIPAPNRYERRECLFRVGLGGMASHNNGRSQRRESNACLRCVLDSFGAKRSGAGDVALGHATLYPVMAQRPSAARQTMPLISFSCPSRLNA